MAPWPAFGLVNCGWLKMLKNSARNWITCRSGIRVVFQCRDIPIELSWSQQNASARVAVAGPISDGGLRAKRRSIQVSWPAAISSQPLFETTGRVNASITHSGTHLSPGVSGLTDGAGRAVDATGQPNLRL